MLPVIRTGVFSVNSLVVPINDDSGESNKCFVVDPAACRLAGDENKLRDYIIAKELKCEGIVLTHSHFDHITGIAPLKEVFPEIKIAIHELEVSELQNPPGPIGSAVIRTLGAPDLMEEVAKQPPADIALKDGDMIFGWKVIHTPGHTPGSICLYNKEQNTLISGDTIFDYGGYGRTDLPGGSQSDMMASLQRLRELIPEGTKVYPGHDSFDFPYSPE